MTIAATADDRSQETAAGTAVLYVPAPARSRAVVQERLERFGVRVEWAADLKDALRRLAQRPVALCLIDLADERGAAPAIRAIRGQHPQVALTGIIDPTRPIAAAEALDAGLNDLLPWPFHEHDVSAMVANAHDGVDPNNGQETSPLPGDGLFAHSPAMRLVIDQARRAADDRGGVLVVGEVGTGRGHVAQAIHRLGARRDRPFVTVECLDRSLEELEQALFGVVAGRDQNGNKGRAPERLSRASALVQANGGTIFLKDLTDAPTRVQASLVRLLRDREATIVEKRAILALDVRPIAGVTPDVESAVTDGRLRRDLYDRLAAVRIDVPPLRRRREDIPILAVQWLRDIRQTAGAPPLRFSRSALALLAALPWPGNGRELRSLLQLLAVSASRPVISLDDVLGRVKLDGLATRMDASGSLRAARAQFERDWISAVLMRHHGRVGEAAKALGIQRTNLYRKVRQLNVARALLASRK